MRIFLLLLFDKKSVHSAKSDVNENECRIVARCCGMVRVGSLSVVNVKILLLKFGKLVFMLYLCSGGEVAMRATFFYAWPFSWQNVKEWAAKP